MILLVFLILWTVQATYPQIGVATSAYQIEGAWNTSCKGMSIWDTFVNVNGDRISDGSTGNIACDHYHHVAEDVKLLADMNIKNYRFSFSWSRIFPSGRPPVCDDGVRFYSELLTQLRHYNITPFATIFHWDLPQALEDEYGGWLDPRIVQDFVDFSRFLFQTFGSRITHWMTLNEPYTYCINGYATGQFAPGVVEPRVSPYMCGHHMLLAHAKTYRLYHDEFHHEQKGMISIALNSDFAFPLRPTTTDARAADRVLEFRMAWFTDPLLKGTYPESMRIRLGERTPIFSPQESQFLNGTLDYFALNHYSSFVVTHHPNHIYDSLHDAEVEYSNPPYRARADSNWLYEVPEGIANMIHWLSQRYRNFFDNHTMIISENGVSMHNYINPVEDRFRIRFLSSYLTEATNGAARNNVSLSHFFIWSLMDNFEWASGYTERFGLVHIDFNDPRRPRTLKYSASKWLKNQ